MQTPTATSAPAYRADVDALRAVAVLAVFLFHLGVTALPGGFVGVDVFYVISGFVIFRALYRETDEGRFSAWRFYRRRICRILPALLVTLAVCLVAGAAVMVPDDYLRLANSALATLVSGSNIYFADRVDYFAPSVRETPLAHTWSLGIEEQFYLLAPLLVLAFGRRWCGRGLVRALAVVSLLSLGWNLVAVNGLGDEVRAFYLPMARLWEIGAGGLIAWLEPRWRPQGAVRTLLAGLGFGGLAASFLLIDETLPYPGLTALAPVAATAAVIAAAIPASGLAGRTLAAAPVLFIGRISYSLYLFHWPLIVFYGLYRETVFSVWEQAGLLAAGIGLAALSWRFVETPFRGAHRRSGRPWAETKIAGVALATGLAALAVSLAAGLPQRLSPAAQAVAAELERITVNPKGCHRVERLAPFQGGQLCTYAKRDSQFGYLLWGDSHARVMGKGLQQLTPVPGLVLDVSACPALLGVRRSDQGNATACDDSQARALALVRDERIPVVVLASRWATVASPVPSPGDGLAPWRLSDTTSGDNLRFADALARTIRRFRSLGVQVILVGPVPEVPFDVPKTLMRAVHLQQPVPANERATFDRRQAEVLPTIAKLANQAGVGVFWPHHRLCDARACRVVDGNTPLYADDDHLSLPGSLRVLPGLANLVLHTVTAARQTAPDAR